MQTQISISCSDVIKEFYSNNRYRCHFLFVNLVFKFLPQGTQAFSQGPRGSYEGFFAV